MFNAFYDLRNLFLFQIMKLFLWGFPPAPRRFIVLHFICQSTNHLELTFCLWFKVDVNIHVFSPHTDFQFIQHPLFFF